jgi:hypothetical protein
VLLRPGQLVADYLAGRRKRHFNPFQFLLLAVGLATPLGGKLRYYDSVSSSVAAQMQPAPRPPRPGRAAAGRILLSRCRHVFQRVVAGAAARPCKRC